MVEAQDSAQLDPGEDQSPRRRTWPVVASVVVFLMLLLTTCTIVAFGSLDVAPSRARFVVRNARCLSCHPERLTAVTKVSTHSPFLKRQCTSCHNEHARLVRVTVEGGEIEGSVTSGFWLRWGPLRQVIEPVQRAVLRTAAAEQRTTRMKQVGKSTLVATPETLCWTCHEGLAPERDEAFPHQPFAVNRCIGCHDPHASDYEGLLRWSSKDLCVMCHPMGQQLNREFAHVPAERYECLSCHDPHASDWKGILTASQRDLCFSCHPSVAQNSLMAVQHQPFGEGDNCTGCHEPHGADAAPLLSAETPDLCYSCHSTLQARFDRASHHPVGSEMDCPSCHQPHASANTGLLVKQERALCTGCHEEIADLASLPVQHGPIKQAENPCTSCHTPHGSSYVPLLRNPKPNLCYGCHNSVGVDMTRVSHHPTDCSKCHRVHASSYEKLLVSEGGNALCYRCHAQIALTYVGSSHGPLECMKCHQPHGSQYGALRQKDPTALCSTCHVATDYIRFVGDGDSAHRSTPEFYDRTAEAPLTCTSTCHNPHGTQYLYMTRNFEWFRDGMCLQCHLGVGIRY